MRANTTTAATMATTPTIAAVRYWSGFSPLISSRTTPMTGSPSVMKTLQTLVIAIPVAAAAEPTL